MNEGWQSLWMKAERQAVIYFDQPSNRNKDEFYSLVKEIETHEVPLSLKGYCFYWKGKFFDKESAIKNLNRASDIWQTLAHSPKLDFHDQAWWLQCAIIALIDEELILKTFPARKVHTLLRKAIRAIKLAMQDPNSINDITVKQTFGIILTEFMWLEEYSTDILKKLIDNIQSKTPSKESLRVELEAFRLLFSNKNNINNSIDLLRKASQMHILLMHKTRCFALAEILKGG